MICQKLEIGFTFPVLHTHSPAFCDSSEVQYCCETISAKLPRVLCSSYQPFNFCSDPRIFHLLFHIPMIVIVSSLLMFFLVQILMEVQFHLHLPSVSKKTSLSCYTVSIYEGSRILCKTVLCRLAERGYLLGVVQVNMLWLLIRNSPSEI